jgi:FkbM family methyltransferase
MSESCLRHTLPNGLSLSARSASELEALYEEVFVERSYLPAEIAVWKGMSVIDAGAHVGLFSICISELLGEGAVQVLALEPAPGLFPLLESNISRLGRGNVRVLNVGLAGRSGRLPFTFYPRAPQMSGLSTYASAADTRTALRRWLLRALGPTARLDEATRLDVEQLLDGTLLPETVDVDVWTLDKVIQAAGWPTVDLLKLDVQGAELDVLRTLDRASWSAIGQIVGEVHDAGGSVPTFVELLEAHAFSVRCEQRLSMSRTSRYAFAAWRVVSGQTSMRE